MHTRALQRKREVVDVYSIVQASRAKQACAPDLWLDVVRLVILNARLMFLVRPFELLVWNAMIFLDVNVCLGKRWSASICTGVTHT